jgi:integrase
MMLYVALEDWLKKKNKWTPKVKQYVWKLADGWKQAWEWSTNVKDLDVQYVDRLETWRDNGKRSAAALNQERMYLKMFWRWMLEHGHVQDDSTVVWKRRREEVKKVYVALEPAQIEALAAALEGDWAMQRFVRLAAWTGMRTGTIRALTPKMFTTQSDGGYLIEVPKTLVKTRESLRFVLSPEQAKQLAGDWVKVVPLTKNQIYKRFKKAIKKAHLPEETSPHDLRRTFVSRLAGKGVPTHLIMAIGGWKSMSTLVKHYSSQPPLEQVAKALEWS